MQSLAVPRSIYHTGRPTRGRSCRTHGGNRLAVGRSIYAWESRPRVRGRAAPPCGRGSRPTRERGRSHTNKGAPSHAGATPHGGHATLSRPPHHARRGGPPCRAKGSQSHEWGSPLSCEWAVPVVLCKAHSRMPRHAWGEPLVWGTSPTNMGVPSALLYECKAPLV